MYPSSFAHLNNEYALPASGERASRKRRGSRRGLRALRPALALRPVSPHSACGESR